VSRLVGSDCAACTAAVARAPALEATAVKRRTGEQPGGEPAAAAASGAAVKMAVHAPLSATLATSVLVPTSAITGRPSLRAGMASSRACVVGLEVKSGHTAKPEWFRWLGQMRDAIGDKFVAGVALYAGDQVLPFGDRYSHLPGRILGKVTG
jgi:hypothetical protein